LLGREGGGAISAPFLLENDMNTIAKERQEFLTKQNQAEILDWFYRWGSEGTVNLFKRGGKFVVQWEGAPTYDSGYAAEEFDTLAEAQEWFDVEKQIEQARRTSWGL
jgi:hypothetical protein